VQAADVPGRFVDGCHTGRTVLWLRSPGARFPVPVILAEVGGVCLTAEGRTLRRTFAAVERVVTFVIDPFPWEEVERLADDLLNHPRLPLRLLWPASSADGCTYDYEAMHARPLNRSIREMENLEALALQAGADRPTLVDGPLKRCARTGELARPGSPLVVGVIKRQDRNYLHPRGRLILLDLRPGERTPYFKIGGSQGGADVETASWFLKLAGARNELPNWGVVRVEVAWVQFGRLPDPVGCVNRLSRWLLAARCRDSDYARAPVSVEPVVRAEDSLKSLLTPPEALRHRFCLQAGVGLGGTS
jgi:hypothetical protein